MFFPTAAGLVQHLSSSWHKAFHVSQPSSCGRQKSLPLYYCFKSKAEHI